jgi:hypothetical protein
MYLYIYYIQMHSKYHKSRKVKMNYILKWSKHYLLKAEKLWRLGLTAFHQKQESSPELEERPHIVLEQLESRPHSTKEGPASEDRKPSLFHACVAGSASSGI